MLQGDDEFDGGDKEFEAACAEEIAFDRARVEESASRAHSHKTMIMVGYKTGTENDPEEEEEEENSEGNRKHLAMDPIGGSRSWEKRNRGEGTLEKKGEPGRVCNGNIKQTRRGGRRRIRGKNLQTSGK